MLADIDNVGEVLTPGRMATLVIYPAEPAQVARVAEEKPVRFPRGGGPHSFRLRKRKRSSSRESR